MAAKASCDTSCNALTASVCVVDIESVTTFSERLWFRGSSDLARVHTIAKKRLRNQMKRKVASEQQTPTKRKRQPSNKRGRSNHA